MRSLPLLLVLCALPCGCRVQAQPADASTDAAPRVATDATPAAPAVGATWERFGGEVGSAAPTPVATLFANSADLDGSNLIVSGEVRSVCKKKGCWMTLGTAEQSMRVTFQDYGFFVPLDCEGREVIVDGRFEVKETPADEVRHYLEDENRHEEAALITEPTREMTFVATGVRMKPAAPPAQ